MTPIKSTDTAGLNAAFAEKVAGWRIGQHLGGGYWITPDEQVAMHSPPDFCHSADAVLKYLERVPEFEIHAAAYSPIGKRFRVRVWPKMTQTSGANDFHTAYADTVPLAAVIALLRSKGVEVVE